MALAKEHKLQREIDRENRDSEINRAMAEVAGWTKCHRCTSCNMWNPPGTDCLRTATVIPNFLTDLDAVHEVEKSLMDITGAWEDYCILLRRNFNRPDSAIGSTARQRCTAILKNLNRWNPEWDHPI